VNSDARYFRRRARAYELFSIVDFPFRLCSGCCLLVNVQCFADVDEVEYPFSAITEYVRLGLLARFLEMPDVVHSQIITNPLRTCVSPLVTDVSFSPLTIQRDVIPAVAQRFRHPDQFVQELAEAQSSLFTSIRRGGVERWPSRRLPRGSEEWKA